MKLRNYNSPLGKKNTLLRFLSVAAALFAPTPPACATASADAQLNAPTIFLVVGTPGAPEYETNMIRQAELWAALARQAGASFVQIGPEDGTSATARDQLHQRLATDPTKTSAPLWLVLIRHGTFDGKEARFNLRGPDLSAMDLAEWLQPFQRPLIILNTASASAPFLSKLSSSNRILVTATRSGHEQNVTRFGLFLAESMHAAGVDLDQDGQISLLEAFLTASRKVAEFYKTEGRLATEHALLDDNGDGRGTEADWFRGIRAVKKPDGGLAVDGARAHQVHLLLSSEEQALPPSLRARRDVLELEVFRLRESKENIPEPEYFNRLESLLLELARLRKGKH